jgi:hypothetical protein
MRYVPRALTAIRRRQPASADVLAPPSGPIHYVNGLPMAVIPLLLVVAVVAYLVGHAGSKSEPAASAPTVRSAHVLLEYPPGWRPVARNPPIPSLPFVRALLLGPGGSSAAAGLVVGDLPAGQPAPLPGQFVSTLKQLPQVQIVGLAEIQAFRYTRVSVPGFRYALDIFVIPNPGSSPTALACYASSSASAYLRACEQAVYAVTVLGQPQTYQLSPESAYAGKISAAIATLDGLRANLKRELRAPVSASHAQQLASALALGFASAAASLSKLEPAPVASQAQAALSTAIEQVRGQYEALAGAAGEHDVSAYTAAQRRVSEAEADVDRALEAFVLLGYSPALSTGPAARS